MWYTIAPFTISGKQPVAATNLSLHEQLERRMHFSDSKVALLRETSRLFSETAINENFRL